MEFVALDVETANAELSSICALGAARFSNGQLVDELYSLINPCAPFYAMNTQIHGISAEMVQGQPTFRQLYPEVAAFVGDSVLASHTHFDRIAMGQACLKWSLPHPKSRWLDTARVVRRAWQERSSSGYGLGPVCKMLNYEFEHHNALEDAKAAGFILIQASEKVGLDIHGWLERVAQPINPEFSEPIRRDGNAEGVLFGEVLVFTGALSMTRREAADMAARVGCDVASGVTKKTTMLVVGDQDLDKLAGHKKSSKHRKAEALIEGGQEMRILRESDFKEMVKLA